MSLKKSSSIQFSLTRQRNKGTLDIWVVGYCTVLGRSRREEKSNLKLLSLLSRTQVPVVAGSPHTAAYITRRPAAAEGARRHRRPGLLWPPPPDVQPAPPQLSGPWALYGLKGQPMLADMARQRPMFNSRRGLRSSRLVSSSCGCICCFLLDSAAASRVRRR
jgi:hypothetical protein